MKRQRAAFTITSVEPTQSYGDGAVEVKAHPIMVGESQIPGAERFHKYTPSGDLRLVVTNPALTDTYHVGDQFYMDLVPIDTD